jgi:subtilase family protein/PKD domain-containing protein
MVLQQEKRMKAFRRGCPWQGSGLLLGLLLWSCLPSPTASQDLTRQLHVPKASSPDAKQRIASSIRTAVQMVRQNGMDTARAQMGRGVRWHNSRDIAVYLHTSILTTAILDTLHQHGVRVLRIDAPSAIVYATVSYEDLEKVGALSSVRWIELPRYSVRRTGSVTSEGDTVMRADLVRTTLGVTGKGVKVGIIADSLCDPATSINSGDLPAIITIVNGQNGCGESETLDEGRVLAEIIHDLAPGATLLFHTGFPTSLHFIAAVQELTAAGAQVIVDDIGFFNEPVFEEGPVAQAVRQAIQQGVVFVSAAGNDAQRHYQGLFSEFNPNDGDPQVNLHDFGGGDTRLDVRIAANATVVVFLQWANPFDGSANTADYDLLLADAAGNTLAISNDDQLNTQAPPLEVIIFTNTTGQPMTVGVVVNRVAGPALPFSLNFNTFGMVTVLKHNVASSSIFGHPCVRDVLAVGAVDVHSPGFGTLEGFSAQGPCEIFFPTHEFRTKPDVAAADGISTSLPDFTPFFGTSAAAPHVAAVAALLMEAGGPGVLSNTRLANILRLTAADRGIPGVDNSFGYGVVDALTAVQALGAATNTAPRSVIDSPGADLVIPPNTSVTFQGNCADAEGNQPFTFAWNFSGVSPPTTVQNPGDITFPTPGVFPITFTCTDATGSVDPAPAARTVTVNSPPESQISSPPADFTIAAGTTMDFAGTCTDPDNNVPLTFLWNFGGGASPSTATEQNPQGVVFNTSGTFPVSFACTDALGLVVTSPATVRVTVSAVNTTRVSGGGGGGGGCTLRPGGQIELTALVDMLGNMFLPVLVLGIIHMLSRVNKPYRLW